jgi:hypothetical protein
LRKGLDNRYALTYVDSLRAELEAAYPTEDTFLEAFEVTDAMLDDFQAFASAEGVEFNEEDWSKSGDAIALRLKAMMGRNLLEQSTFYRVISGLNESLERAIEILQDGTFEKANLAHDTF